MAASSTITYERKNTVRRDQLIIDNVDYVARILSTMALRAKSADDRESLNSAGLLGLVEAANSFDPAKGIAFRTFAYPRIRGAILDELRKQSPVSQRVLGKIKQLRKAYERLQPPVTPELLSSETGLPIDQILECLEAMRFVKPEGWNDLSDVVHGSWREQPASPESQAEQAELRNLLAEAMEQLPEKERLVLTLYFTEEMNLAEIGLTLDVSESWASRLLASAKFRLQEIVRCKTK